jgi:hypothetical protein
MGMDVIGRSPSAEVGEYFYNNMWWWRPLWDYCQEVARDLIPEGNLGHFNDGWGLDEHEATKLAERLLAELASGRTAQYEKTHVSYWREESTEGRLIRALGQDPSEYRYCFCTENVREFAGFLKHSGGFSIW